MTQPYYEDDRVTLYHGDCLEVLRALPDASIDSVVTDPPYGIRFMGKAWDGADIVRSTAVRQGHAAMPDDGKSGRNGGYRSASTEAGRYDLSANAAFALWVEQWATECLRVLKPGGHMLAFGGSRTWHRLAAGIEDAGFEIRDSIAWLYASGFPKSLDVSKAIDKAAGHWRGRAEAVESANGSMSGGNYSRSPKGTPITPAAAAAAGYGTALKPSFEPIVVARKPLSGTVAANWLDHGTGALNIDACRIHTPGSEATAYTVKRLKTGATLNAEGGNWRPDDPDAPTHAGMTTAGRWPTNVFLDQGMAADLDAQSGTLTLGTMRAGTERQPRIGGTIYGADQRNFTPADTYGDSGGASRFFPVFRWQAKAASSERPNVAGVQHPTVKPLDLMRWCARLVTPSGGTILDPFAGSGTTGEAAVREGFSCVLIEREADYLPLITSRLKKPLEVVLDFGGAS